MNEDPLALKAAGRKFIEEVPKEFAYMTRQHAKMLQQEWFKDGIIANEKMPGKANLNGIRVINSELAQTRF